jgi:hypothetical protein
VTVRTAYVGSEAAGDTLTAANFNKLPGGLVGYAVRTTDQTGISTEADITSLSIPYTFVAGRLYRLSLWCRTQQVTTNGNQEIYITDGASTHLAVAGRTVAAGTSDSLRAECLYTGSGSVTIKARAAAAAGTVTILGGVTYQPLLTIEDLGVSF